MLKHILETALQHNRERKKFMAYKKDIGEKLGFENIYDLIGKERKGKFETKNPTNEQIREYK